MKKLLDARGLACPLPVVNTKNAIRELGEGDEIEVLVDNEIAVQNLTKFAKVRGHGAKSDKITDNHYRVTLTVGSKAAPETEEEITCELPTRSGDIVVLSADHMGEGSQELGKALMKAFIFALTKQEVYPKTILLYNGGAQLSCEGSDSLEDLRFLESQGVEILTCGTCLNFYKLADRLVVGGVTNMYDIVERMGAAAKIIKP